MSVEFQGRTIYYMGDTRTGFHPLFDCPGDANCNDMMAISWDNTPEDGVNVLIVESALNSGIFLPQMVPGVHYDIAPELEPTSSGFWGDKTLYGYIEPQYTVPTGVVVAHPTFLGFPFEMVMLWYSTAIHPGGSYPPREIDSSDPRTRPTSWTGCSFDGLNFYKCYPNVPPFSIDETSPYNEPARFIQVAAIEITAADFESVCPGGDSRFCNLYNASVPATARGGLLLYGSGRPYRKSGLFLAYIRNVDIFKETASGKPTVWYWNGSDWSTNEQDAVSLTHYPGAPLCDNYMNENECWPYVEADRIDLFGELSAKLIRSASSEESVIVLMSNHLMNDPDDENVRARTARLSTPWIVSGPSPTGTRGYGPYIIDEYIEHDGYTGDIGLYHVISVWGDGPYGVYTGYEEVAWP